MRTHHPIQQQIPQRQYPRNTDLPLALHPLNSHIQAQLKMYNVGSLTELTPTITTSCLTIPPNPAHQLQLLLSSAHSTLLTSPKLWPDL